MPPKVDAIVTKFVNELSAALEAYAQSRAAAAIEEALGNGAAAHAAMGPRRPGRPPGRGRATRQSAEAGRYKTVSAGRRLQGQYLGRLRALKGRDRAQVKAVARKEGVEKAVRLANDILRRNARASK